MAKYYSPNGKAIQDNGVTPSVQQAESETPSGDDDDPDVQPLPESKPGEDAILKRALGPRK